MRAIILLLFFMTASAMAETKLDSVPDGYKLVKVDSECKDKDPCAKEKAELAKLKQENQRLAARVRLLENEIDSLRSAKKQATPACPKVEPKIIYKEIEKIKNIPVEKTVEVEKPTVKKNVFRLMGAIGQDGIESEGVANENYSREVTTYYSSLGGAGYTRFFDSGFGAGVFGMFGVTNRTIGLSGEYAF